MSLENYINNIILSTKLQYIHKYQYNNLFRFFYVDFICDTPNFIICIYTNYLFHNINGFLYELNIIQQYYNKPIFGIYMTFTKPSTQDDKKINDLNKKHYNIFNIVNIYNSNISNLLNLFINILYSYKIYCYDYSGDCIMIS